MLRGGNAVHSSLVRVLATYAVACFVVLQLLDIVLEPLGVPVSAIRWVVLVMVAVAPFIVIVVALRKHRQAPAADESITEPGQDAVFRIGHAELDTAQRQIRFAGKPVDVQPKVFDLITYLVQCRDRVVGKDELFDQVWPAVVVTEASLTQSVKRARDLFRQNGFEKDVIRTVSRKGYQFDGAVEIIDMAAQSEADIWSDVVLPTAAVGLVAVALGMLVWNSSAELPKTPRVSNAANSLVVLPFANLTPDQDFSYFSDGLTETVTNSLTTVREIRVIARGSAFSFRGTQPDYAVIGDELNVAYIVEGSVQRNDDELRISARLIRAQDGQQIWSRIYSRSFDNMFAMQDEISRSIVDQMSGLLSTTLVLAQSDGDEVDTAASSEAYRLLLLGQDKTRTSSADGLLAAETYFREALLLRPNYPEAMIGLANALRIRATLGELPRDSTFAEAVSLIRDALEQRPNYAEAYLQLGEIQHRHFWDFDAAAESYARALELSPGSASARSAYSRFLSKAGEFEQSVREAEIAQDLDPKSAQAASSLAIRQIRARDLERARTVIDAMTQMHPGNANLPWLETNWHIRNGSYRDALSWAALEELDYLRLSLSSIALYRLERMDQARAALDELIETDKEAAFQIAEAYAQWGQTDDAFEWLEQAFSAGDPGLAELYSSVNLESLYDDDRFTALAAKVGLPPLNIL